MKSDSFDRTVFSATIQPDGRSLHDHLETYTKDTALSDVPLSIGLSGGLDSTYIAARLSKRLSKAFTIGYEHKGGSDEVSEAKRIASFLGIEHSARIIKSHEIYSLFKKSVCAKDLPISDIAGIGYYALYEKAAVDGFKVILMGHGGDEIFMGYPWLYKSYIINRSNTCRYQYLYQTLEDFRVYFKLLKTIMPAIQPWLAYPNIQGRGRDPYSITVESVTDFWLQPNTLKMGDALSMSNGVEARHPLINLGLYGEMCRSEEKSYSIKPKEKLRDQLMKELPNSLVQQNKKYFTPPLGSFYKAIYDGIQSEILRNPMCKYLLELRALDTTVVDHVLYGSTFRMDALTYYLFPRLATLHVWLGYQMNSKRGNDEH